ncbi:MAG TPA: hypothetical protein PKA90_03065, partial [Ignavibacteria bacterium]|nr:hypothetical protein [Ignavibacteria bacterium]HMR39389.1 hypothetical protein [Ignavibacteria bacterium]
MTEIHIHWRQKIQLTARQKSTAVRLRQDIFAFRQSSEFLFGNLSQEVRFISQLEIFDSEVNFKQLLILQNVLD